MTTLADIIARTRYRIRDPHSHISVLDNSAMISLANGVLGEVRDILQNLESNLVYGHDTIITVASTPEYTPSFSHEGFMDEGVWINGEDWFLTPAAEADKVGYDVDSSTRQPERYYFTEAGDVGFLWVPDDAYTVNVQYWNPLTELTATTDTIPWRGVWDSCIERMLTLACLEVLKRDISVAGQHVSIAMSQALSKTFNLGCRERRRRSNFFAEGV